jgi:hypothetical protein
VSLGTRLNAPQVNDIIYFDGCGINHSLKRWDLLRDINIMYSYYWYVLAKVINVLLSIFNCLYKYLSSGDVKA